MSVQVFAPSHIAAACFLACSLALPVWAADMTWGDLSAAEKQALAPLQAQWPQMDEAAKQRWREIAKSYSEAPPPTQDRMQTRMREWASMSADERERARKNFQAARASNPEEIERQKKWREYQALDPQEKERLRQKVQK